MLTKASLVMDRYADGDRIFLFGFSRGAFVARALAGFLDCCGLLFQGNDESVTLAWHIYADMTEDKRPDGEQVAAGFQRTFSRSVPIHFLGVFDTVASVGSLIPRTLPFSQGAQTISTFRHALALDERRVRFAPQLWMKPRRDYALRQMQRKAEMRHTDKISRAYSEPELSTHDELDRVTLPNGEVVGTRDVKEVFFAGGHSDVGGGATLSDAPPKLSHIPLRWLVREAVRKGLVVDETVLVSSQLYRAFVEEARKLVGPTGTATNFREFFDGDTHGDKPNEFVCALIETASRPTVPVTPDNVDAFLSSPSQVDSPFVRDALAPQHDRLAFSGTSNQGMWHALKHKLLSLVYWTLELGPNLSFVWTPTGEVRKALIVCVRHRLTLGATDTREAELTWDAHALLIAARRPHARRRCTRLSSFANVRRRGCCRVATARTSSSVPRSKAMSLSQSSASNRTFNMKTSPSLFLSCTLLPASTHVPRTWSRLSPRPAR